MRKKIIAVLILGLIGVSLLMVVAEMPSFGERKMQPERRVYEHYLERGPQETGAVNIVSAIITDYRAFDTLGETTVLFATVAAIYAVLLSAGKQEGDDEQ